ERGDPVMQIALRVPAANRTLARFTEQEFPNAALEVRRQGKSNKGSKVIPVLIVKRDTGIAADKVQASDGVYLASGRGRRGKEISESRDTVHVLIIWLDRQAISN